MRTLRRGGQRLLRRRSCQPNVVQRPVATRPACSGRRVQGECHTKRLFLCRVVCRVVLTETDGVWQRALHDLVTLAGRKPIISHGPPGYSAVSGHVVTVFGCTGFLGRYLVSKLGACPADLYFTPVHCGHRSPHGHTSHSSVPRRGREETSQAYG